MTPSFVTFGLLRNTSAEMLSSTSVSSISKSAKTGPKVQCPEICDRRPANEASGISTSDVFPKQARLFEMRPLTQSEQSVLSTGHVQKG
jgi:hypothetical protein